MVACAKSMSGMMRRSKSWPLAAQRFQIRTHKAVRDLGQMAMSTSPAAACPGCDGERLFAPVAVGNGDGNSRSTGPGRRRAVEQVGQLWRDHDQLPRLASPSMSASQLATPFSNFPHEFRGAGAMASISSRK